MGSFAIKSGTAVMDLPPAHWAIEGLVPSSGLTQLFAPPSSAKSLLALHMALSMSLGRDCLGLKTEPQDVLMLVGEGSSDLAARVEAWCLHQGVDPATLDRFHVLTQPLDVASSDLDVLSDDLDARGLHPVLVVDTLARYTPSISESSISGMNALVDSLGRYQQRHNRAVILVHHAAKNEPDSSRGAGSLDAASDSIIRLARAGDTVTLHHAKSKFGAELDPMTLSLIPSGQSVTVDLAPTAALANAAYCGLLSLTNNATDKALALRHWQDDFNSFAFLIHLDADFVLEVLKPLLEGGYVETYRSWFVATPKGHAYAKAVA